MGESSNIDKLLSRTKATASAIGHPTVSALGHKFGVIEGAGLAAGALAVLGLADSARKHKQKQQLKMYSNPSSGRMGAVPSQKGRGGVMGIHMKRIH